MMTLVEGKTPVNSDNLRMFDFRGVPEDREFINDFRAHVMKDVARRKEFLARVRERNNRDAVPLCFYGDKVVTARGHNRTLALRQEVLTPLTDAVRCLALEKGIMAFGTTQRLEALAEAGVFKAQTAADLANAYTWLARMSLQRAFEAESGLDWIIDPRHCTSDEKRLLTECFHVIRECVGLAS
jgi:CBS domain-containing protein